MERKRIVSSGHNGKKQLAAASATSTTNIDGTNSHSPRNMERKRSVSSDHNGKKHPSAASAMPISAASSTMLMMNNGGNFNNTSSTLPRKWEIKRRSDVGSGHNRKKNLELASATSTKK